jgi:Family of unknown function (DUF5677)
MHTAIDCFNSLQIIPRDFRIYPFDTVALELLSKSISITRSCLLLIEGDQVDEAFGLSRSLVEAALILRHITRDKDLMFRESDKFLKFAFKEKAFWLFQGRQTFKDIESVEDMDRFTAKWDFASSNPMAFTRSWSDQYSAWAAQTKEHPVDTSHSLEHNHPLNYSSASSFVHCTQPSLDNYFPTTGIPFQVKLSTQEYVDTRGSLFYLLINNLHRVVLYVLFGFDLKAFQLLVQLYEEVLADAEPTDQEIYLGNMVRAGKVKRWRR